MLDRIAFLSTTDLFAEMPEHLFRRIGRDMQEVTAKAGTTIFREGDAGNAAYVVVDGILSIRTNGVQLVTRSRGECVGEFALIDDAPRSASAVATTDVLLLKWERSCFQEAISQSREISNGLFRILLSKLRQDVKLQTESALERERWRQDLKRAHEIQKAMLPQADMSLDHVEISGYCQPAADVGGDYYDYLLLERNKLGIIISDVTGHGFYAGLFAAMAKSCLHTQARIDSAPAKVMEAMNHTVFASIQSGLLMSCCYVLVDFDSHTLAYCNAGHPYPFHYRSRGERLERLVSTDILLGVPGYETCTFATGRRDWGKGDLLLVFSDGIPEATDGPGEHFGEQRLERALLAGREHSPAEIRDSVLNALSDHCTGVPQSDDITLVVAKAL